jgi:hypothetical protein
VKVGGRDRRLCVGAWDWTPIEGQICALTNVRFRQLLSKQLRVEPGEKFAEIVCDKISNGRLAFNARPIMRVTMIALSGLGRH